MPSATILGRIFTVSDFTKLFLIVLALVTVFLMLASRDKYTAVGIALASAGIGVVGFALLSMGTVA